MKTKFVAFLILITFLISCGKKTEPISLDTIKIPAVDISKTVELTDKGVLIKNMSKYTMLVEKSEIINNCANKFKVLTKIKPKSTFTDVNVEKGKNYIYNFYNIDENLKLFSDKVSKKLTFNLPVKVKDFQFTIKDSKFLKANLTFSDEIGYYEIYFNSKLIKKTKSKEVEIALEDKKINKVTIIPYDKYFNRGIFFEKDIFNISGYELASIEGLKFIKSGKKVILSWNSVKNAKGYKIYGFVNGKKRLIKTVYENYDILDRKISCLLGVSAFNEYIETDITSINICK